MNWGKRESESGEGPGPPCKVFKPSHDLSHWDGVQSSIEKCMEFRCLCSLKLEDITQHLQPLINNSCTTGNLCSKQNVFDIKQWIRDPQDPHFF